MDPNPPDPSWPASSCRKDLVIDGFVLGRTTISGSDSTDAVLDMYRRLGRPDINCVLLSGLIISMYNIVDAGKICKNPRIPVIGVSYRDSDGISDIIRDRFDADRGKEIREPGDAPRGSGWADQKYSSGAPDARPPRRDGCFAP